MTTPVPTIDPTKNPPSPKVIGLATVMLLVQAVTALTLYFQSVEGEALFSALPVWLVVVVRSVIAGLASFLVGLRSVDPQRILDLAMSPKVLAGTLVGIVAQAVLDVAAFLQGDGSGIYEGWNPVLVVLFTAVLPGVAAFAAGYVVKDPARMTPQNPNPVAQEPVVAPDVVDPGSPLRPVPGQEQPPE